MATRFSTRGATHGGKPFEMCPPGPQQLVVCDLVDHGMVRDTWRRGAGEAEDRMIHKCTVKWQSVQAMADGRPYLVSKRYTASMHEKASLRIDIGLMRGRKITDDEADSFDVEGIIGWNCFANIEHVNKGSKGTFAEVMSLMPLPAGMKKITVRDYRRESAPKPPAQPAAADARATEPPPNSGEAWEPDPQPEDPERSFDYDAPVGREDPDDDDRGGGWSPPDFE